MQAGEKASVQTLMQFLNDFEAIVLASLHSENTATDLKPEDQMCAIQRKFGKPKQQQIDDWLELKNQELKDECLKYGLPVSDRHIHNIQTLFNYMKSFEDPQD